MAEAKLAVEDRIAILDLLARYNHLFDAGQGNEWAACFTPEGEFSGPAGEAKGTQQLIEFCHATSAKLRGALHLTDHHLFEVEGNVVLHKCVLSVHFPSDRGVQTLLYRYSDELVAIDGQWRLRRRQVLPA